MRTRQSEYMYWAKTASRAPYNLATSGVRGFPLEELPSPPLEINTAGSYGYAPLRMAIAQRHGVDPDCVVSAAGTSMANHLAMAALVDPGDEVLIEHPAYELLVSTARYLGAEVRRFHRTEESGYALDPAEVRRALTPRTRLIVVTNLHNPSSAFASDAVLREIGDLARSVGAHVLVDEVYLDAVYENTPRTSLHLGPEFIVTSSLTKVYGLSGLRCGWILAEPDLTRAIWRLNDLFGVNAAHFAEMLSVAAFDHLDLIRAKSRAIVEADRAVLREFLAREPGVTAPATNFGTVSFVRLEHGDPEAFLDRLRARYETSVAPGRFFEMPRHFRIGMGVDSAMFAEGLRRMASALAG